MGIPTLNASVTCRMILYDISASSENKLCSEFRLAILLICRYQTGSGKTYTMFGAGGVGGGVEPSTGECDGTAGVTPRAVLELFRVLKEREGQFEYKVTVSMFELYRDGLRDLVGALSLYHFPSNLLLCPRGHIFTRQQNRLACITKYDAAPSVSLGGQEATRSSMYNIDYYIQSIRKFPASVSDCPLDG